MAYGEGGVGTDLDRNRQYSDVKGSTQGNAEGAVDISGSFTKFNKALLGQDTTNPDPYGSSRNARVDIANPGFQTNPGSGYPSALNNQYNFQSDGEPGLLGQDTDDYSDRRPYGDDSQRPSLPNLNLPGAAGTSNAGQQGQPVDWNSVGPYEYPEYPKDSYNSTYPLPGQK